MMYKVIGTVLGFFILGPIGALVGLAIGYVLDSRNAYQKANIEEFMEINVAGLVSIASVDGTVSEAETKAIEYIYNQLDSSNKEIFMRYFRTGLLNSKSPQDIARIFSYKFSEPNLKSMFFNSMMRVALANGSMNAIVRKCMDDVAEILAIKTDSFSDFSDKNSDLDEAYVILGVLKNATDEEIKKMYRMKCKDLHPDVIKSKGLGVFAEEALKNELSKVNEAYELIKKSRKN